MFKFILLLVAIYAGLAHGRPSYLPSYPAVEYAPTIVGHTYESLPTAVSHQSSTVVHEKRPYWRPIVTYAAEPLHSYSSGWYEPEWSTTATTYPSSSSISYPTSYWK